MVAFRSGDQKHNRKLRDIINPTQEIAQDRINHSLDRVEKLEADLEAKQKDLADQQAIHREANAEFMAAQKKFQEVVAETDKAERSVKQTMKDLGLERRELTRHRQDLADANYNNWTEARKKQVDEERAKRGPRMAEPGEIRVKPRSLDYDPLKGAR